MTVIPPFRKVVLESPYRDTETHSTEQHRVYLSHCITDAESRWEAVYASHSGLRGDDSDDLERELGIRRGWAIGDLMDACVVYTDFGISSGMAKSISHYESIGMPIIRRTLTLNEKGEFDDRLVRSIREME